MEHVLLNETPVMVETLETRNLYLEVLFVLDIGLLQIPSSFWQLMLRALPMCVLSVSRYGARVLNKSYQLDIMEK